MVAPPQDVRGVPEVDADERRHRDRARPSQPAYPRGTADDRAPSTIRPRSQQREHGRRVGPDAAPENEALGGLLDQHAETVRPHAARPARRPAQERRGRVGRTSCRTRSSPAGTTHAATAASRRRQSRTRRVDHHIEVVPGQRAASRPRSGPPPKSATDERLGLHRRAVADRDRARALREAAAPARRGRRRPRRAPARRSRRPDADG